MTSIERTAYPQFRRLTSARVLHVFFTPAAEEVAWARERTASPEALLALVLDLKCFPKTARFCSREESPEVVVGHVRRCLGLGSEGEPDHGAARMARWHGKQVRIRQGVTYGSAQAGYGGVLPASVNTRTMSCTAPSANADRTVEVSSNCSSHVPAGWEPRNTCHGRHRGVGSWRCRRRCALRRPR
jgi:hypothetical protein